MMEWETIAQSPAGDDITQRLKVPGGWLVRCINGIHLPKSMTMAYCPDFKNDWEKSST